MLTLTALADTSSHRLDEPLPHDCLHRMNTIDLRHQITTTPATVKTPTTPGWVTRITGTHPQHKLERMFFDRVTPNQAGARLRG